MARRGWNPADRVWHHCTMNLLQRHTTHASRCFRTNHEGDILLRNDWTQLLTALHELGEWYVQSRHPYGRLVSRMTLPDWNADASCTRLQDPEGLVHLNLPQWDHAVARLETCPCCASPGRIDMRNAAHHSFMELRAVGGHTLNTLADLTSRFCAHGGVPPVSVNDTPTRFALFSGDVSHAVPSATLPGFLRRCADSGLPLLWRLLTPEIDHRCEFVPERLTLNGGLLTVADDADHSCQLILPAAHCLITERCGETLLLHVLDEHKSLLFTLTAGNAPLAFSEWRHLLGQLTPDLLIP